jgi:hypothetical protein
MTAILNHLLRRSPLLSHESLHSFIERLVISNHFHTTAQLTGLLNCVGYRYPQIGIFTESEDYARLSHLSDVPEIDLYKASIHRFSKLILSNTERLSHISIPGGQDIPIIDTKKIHKRFRDPSSAQYCPECLREEPYHRVDWFPVASSVCLCHKRFLSTQCGQCGKPVSIRSIVRNCCQQCGWKLSNTVTQIIEDDEIGLFSQALIQNWIGTAISPMTPWPFSMPRYSPAALYNVADGICSCLKISRNSWFNTIVHHFDGVDIQKAQRDLYNGPKASPMSMYIVFATAIRILGDWPVKFREFLHKYPLRDGSSEPSGVVYEDYGHLYYSCLENRWRAPAFRFVQEEFNKFVMKEYGVTFSVIKTGRYNRRKSSYWVNPTMDFDTAAHHLGLSIPAFVNLIKKGRLHEYCFSYSSSTSQRRLVSKSEIEKLKNEWGWTVDLEEAAKLLNLSEPVIRELIGKGLIKAYSGPEIDANPRWVIGKTGIQSLSDIARKAISILPNEHIVTCNLAQAAQILSGYDVNSASLINRALQGKMIAFFSPKVGENYLGDLVFPREAIFSLQKEILSERRWISRSEIAHRMGVKETIVSRWVATNKLTPVSSINHVQYFNKEVADHFIQNHIFTKDAASILGVGLLTVQKWAKRGRLSPIAGPSVDGGHRYLFRRDEIERLNSGSRLSAPQMARQLGLSRSQTQSWIKSGKIHPVSGPGIDRTGRYLFVNKSDSDQH